METDTDTVKKGNRSWQPASSRLAIKNAEPGYAYKWVSISGEDTARIEEHEEMGYVVADGTADSRVSAVVGPAFGGLGTVRRVRTLVLMKAPQEIVDDRRSKIDAETDAQTLKPADRMRSAIRSEGRDDSIVHEPGGAKRLASLERQLADLQRQVAGRK